MPTAIIIPARFASSRFPGKPLARQTGKFLIQHVVEQAQKSTLAKRVLVATDDDRIFNAVKSFGGHPVMTSPSHASGTDRIAEVIRRPEFAGVQTIVNVQGDEPEIDPALIDSLIRSVSSGRVHMATASAPFQHPADIQNPNQVKVVTDHHNLALYFSRAIVPYDRDRLSLGEGTPAPDLYRKHLGIYAYTRDALLTLSTTPVCDLERLEKLEQLRALFLGMKIAVLPTNHAPHGIDTPEDYAAFVKRMAAQATP